MKAIRLHGPLDTGALHGAVRRLVDRHAGLRTVFRAAGDSAVQVVRDTLEPDFAVVDGVRGDGRTVPDVLTEESDRRYDLENGPLFTTRVVRTGDDEHVLVMAFHHIVVDAASATILCRDLSALYRSELDGTGPACPNRTGATPTTPASSARPRTGRGPGRTWRTGCACSTATSPSSNCPPTGPARP